MTTVYTLGYTYSRTSHINTADDASATLPLDPGFNDDAAADDDNDTEDEDEDPLPWIMFSCFAAHAFCA